MKSRRGSIRVQNLSKRYRLGDTRGSYRTLRDAVSEAMSAPFRGLGSKAPNGAKTDHWALQDVSFEVPAGQVVGIVGRNGAGKSTLLKILSRITEPTSGRAEICGRVASLLEVGTGFHVELSGRENIFLNGAILGMPRKEIERKFDDIVQFAEVEKFIDTPVKRYSSGMYLRLAFAVSAHLEPEILVVDEVLAVGDAEFQKKCLGRMEKDAASGRTVLFVSHNMSAVNSLCSRAILLNAGQVVADGPAGEITSRYIAAQRNDSHTHELTFDNHADLPGQVAAVRIRNSRGMFGSRFHLFDPITVEIDYLIRESMTGAALAADIVYQGDVLFSTWDTDEDPCRFERREPGSYSTSFDIPQPLLKAGMYSVRVGLGVPNVRGVHNPTDQIDFEVGEENVPVTLMSYSMIRPGRLAIPISWRTD